MQAWEEFLNKQEEVFGKESVDKWLRTLKVANFDAGNLYLEANDAFQLAWFEEHIREKIQKELLRNNRQPIQVHIFNTNAPSSNKKSRPKKEGKRILFPTLSSDPLDPHARFESFFIAEKNSVAVHFLQNFTPAHYNPIYIYGSKGSGKTHLLMSIAQQFQAKDLRVFYVHAETFTDHVVKAIRLGSMSEFRKAYRETDLLLIDDVHIFARKWATQEEFFHTFNTLQSLQKQIILTSHSPPHLLTEIEPRLISRFEWGITLQIERLQPHELRQLLLKWTEEFGLSLTDPLIDYLITTFSLPKSLLQAIQALSMRLPHHEKKLTKPILEELLRDLIIQQRAAAISPEKIIAKTAELYELESADVLGKSQNHTCCLARQIAMYLCRHELQMPYLKIGKVFSRDHSTVMSSVKLIEEKKEAEKELSASLIEILRRLAIC